MERWGLLVDVRLSGVRLCAVSNVADSTPIYLTDSIGRDLIPLESHLLWHDADGADTDLLRLHERIRWVTALVVENEEQQQPTDDDADEYMALQRQAFDSLLQGTKQFAERQLQCNVSDLEVVVGDQWKHPSPSSSARPYFGSPQMTKRAYAALTAYDLLHVYSEMDVFGHIVVVDVGDCTMRATVTVVEDGIPEILATSRQRRGISTTDLAPSALLQLTIQEALVKSNVTLAQVDGVVLMGDMNSVQANEITRQQLDGFLPSNATVYASIAPTLVALHGAMPMLQYQVEHSDESIVLCSLQPSLMTIGVETAEGIMTALLPRYRTIPTARTSRIRIYHDDDTMDDSASVTLHFFEGDRAFARDNVPLGDLQVSGRVAGWNEIELRVNLTAKMDISIEATLVRDLSTRSAPVQLTASSVLTKMPIENITEYLANLQENPTEEEERAARQTIERQLCTEDLIRTAHDLLHRRVPYDLLRSGQVLPWLHRVVTSVVDPNPFHGDNVAVCSAEPIPAADQLTALLGGGGLDEDVPSVHDGLLELLERHIVWEQPIHDRCTSCQERQRGAYRPCIRRTLCD